MTARSATRPPPQTAADPRCRRSTGTASHRVEPRSSACPANAGVAASRTAQRPATGSSRGAGGGEGGRGCAGARDDRGELDGVRKARPAGRRLRECARTDEGGEQAEEQEPGDEPAEPVVEQAPYQEPEREHSGSGQCSERGTARAAPRPSTTDGRSRRGSRRAPPRRLRPRTRARPAPGGRPAPRCSSGRCRRPVRGRDGEAGSASGRRRWGRRRGSTRRCRSRPRHFRDRGGSHRRT